MTTATRQTELNARADVRELAKAWGEPWDVYHARPGVSSSMVNCFLRSPRIYEAVYITKTIQSEYESDAMDLGTGVHAWAFEPEDFAGHVAIIPQEVLASNGSRNTNKYRAWAKEHDGYALLKEDDWDRVKRMRRALYANDLAAELLGGHEFFEHTIAWTCPETRLERRSRLDCITDFRGRKLIVDLKTAGDHSPEAFESSCRRLGYARQAAFYQDAYEAAYGDRPGFVFLVVRTKPPHVVRPYALGRDEMELGRRQVSDALVEMAQRYSTGNWSEPGENIISEITMKPWAMREEAA